MKVICDRGALVESLGLVGGVVVSRTPKPVLTCVKLSANNDGLVLEATDTEVSVRLSTPRVEVADAGEALIPADKFQQIVRESIDPTLTLHHRAGRGPHRRPGLEVQDLRTPPHRLPRDHRVRRRPRFHHQRRRSAPPDRPRPCSPPPARTRATRSTASWSSAPATSWPWSPPTATASPWPRGPAKPPEKTRKTRPARPSCRPRPSTSCSASSTTPSRPSMSS